MGLFDVFKRKSPVEKLTKELTEVYAQPDYRRTAMNKLIELGTPEARTALLRRFTFNANGHIADESEKRDLVDEIVRIGAPMLEPLRNFIRTEKAVEFPIRALLKLESREAVRDFLIATLSALEPLDHRTTERKRGLITALADLAYPQAASCIVPFLGDHSDDVQFQAIEALETLGEPSTFPALVEVCVGSERAGRIQRRAATVLEKLEISVRDRFEAFNAELKAEFMIGKKGQLLRKSASSSQRDAS